jgi:hypothetical protein
MRKPKRTSSHGATRPKMTATRNPSFTKIGRSKTADIPISETRSGRQVLRRNQTAEASPVVRTTSHKRFYEGCVSSSPMRAPLILRENPPVSARTA